MSNLSNIVLGTMTLGERVNYSEALKMVEYFLELGYQEIDTAYVYNEGQSEIILGKILKEINNPNVKIATKVNPRVTGKLDFHGISQQLDTSLQRLQVDRIHTLYLHFPDPTTPVEETLKVCNDLYMQGKFVELGLSNFPAWQVVDIWHKCKENNWLKPTVYQGMYNILSRKVEAELLPALIELNMSFYAYNPLAGGLLSGKYHQFEESPDNGRFVNRPNYKDRYWKKSVFNAIEQLELLGKARNQTLLDLAFGWLVNYSGLRSSNDKIIIGASKLEHLKSNIAYTQKINSKRTKIELFNEIWEIVKSDSPEYFRTATKTKS